MAGELLDEGQGETGPTERRSSCSDAALSAPALSPPPPPSPPSPPPPKATFAGELHALSLCPSGEMPALFLWAWGLGLLLGSGLHEDKPHEETMEETAVPRAAESSDALRSLKRCIESLGARG